jgi:glutathione S-transferase
MHKLWHFRLCALSRSVRMALSESRIAFAPEEVAPWALPPAFLAVNPAGELPVLELADGPVLSGTYAISEFIAEELAPHADALDGPAPPPPLFPGSAEDRAEVRRLVDWFHGKMQREVTREFINEKVVARLAPKRAPAPDAEFLRAIRGTFRYHLSYVAFLAYQRRWLAGDKISFADFAAAAHLSTLDYLGEVPWDQFPPAKEWYQRMKSRPALRDVLSDRLAGAPPAAHYANLDF